MRFTFCNDLNNHSAILSHQSISPVYSTSSPPQAHWTCPLEAGGSGPPTWPAHSTLQEALTVPKLSPLNLHGNRAKASLRNINGLSSWPENITSASHFVLKWESLQTPTQGTESIKNAFRCQSGGRKWKNISFMKPMTPEACKITIQSERTSRKCVWTHENAEKRSR